jgi:hypothetical protein
VVKEGITKVIPGLVLPHRDARSQITASNRGMATKSSTPINVTDRR